jgi:oligopeptide/dipeptide ABC transporter ATP-binding protein
LLLADEPTTGLDVLVQDQILESIAESGVRAGKAMLLITHDMGVVAENCDRIAVMYAGRIVELGDHSLFETAQHPYTLGLCNAFPNLNDRRRSLVSIPGSPPSLFASEGGCCFRRRCPFATERCLREPPIATITSTHAVACHYIEPAEEFRRRALEPATWQAAETVVL